MKITTVAVSYNRKFNLGNYNSVDLSCSLWAQIDPQEEEDTCIQILQDKCREHVRGEYHKAKNGSKPVETFRVNISTQSDADDSSNYDDDLTVYDGLEPSEVLDIGDK